MSDYEFATVEKKGAILSVTINRAERMNALHPPANDELAAIFDDFEQDPSLWVAIITGAGEKAFSAGNDLRYQAEGNKVTVPPSGFAGLTARYERQKPVIAAVNGFAMGGGFEIALACDIIIAAEHARFALPEPKVGLAALAGGLQRLPREIGLKQAMGMVLTARQVSAAEGERLGFVNAVISADRLMDTAYEWAEMICACSPMSLKASRQVMVESLKIADLAKACDNTLYPAVKDMINSEDAIEGPLAFAEKRAPQWKGK